MKEIFNNNLNEFTIGTHNGVFHCDEVVAIAIVSLTLEKTNKISIIRSRNIEYLKKTCNILIDIGSGQFDHHQKGGNGERENNVKYASSGLVWEKFGVCLIKLLANDCLTETEYKIIFKDIDEKIIQNIDRQDNGEKFLNHPFEFISTFLPKWHETADYDFQFQQALDITQKIIKEIIKEKISIMLAYQEINKIISKSNKSNIIILPNQTIPWTEILINYNNISENKIDFVVFPYPNGGYAIQCVPPSLNEIFAQRIPFPKSWGGETERLPIISGVETATFCHNGLFFARAKNKEDILKLGKIATKEYIINNSKSKKKCLDK